MTEQPRRRKSTSTDAWPLRSLADQGAAAAHPATGPCGEAAGVEPLFPRGLKWLVDGYNALHACLLKETRRQRWWTADGRERLLARARRFEDPEAEIWVVFDGGESQQAHAPPPEPGRGRAERPPSGPGPAGGAAAVHVVFAPSADDWITGQVRRAERPDRIAVVTGDRQVAGRCSHRGARVLAPRVFLAGCREAPASTPGSAAP